MKASDRMRIAACFLACVTGAGTAMAQSPATTIAGCHAIAASMERLACYDTASGRSAGAPTRGEPPAKAGAIPAAAATRAEGTTEPAAAQASMIDAAWEFDPSKPRYISFYRSNYLLLGRYTSDVNIAPFVPLAAALGEPVPDLNKTEAKFQFSFKAHLWGSEDRLWDVWAAYTQQSQWQVYNGDVSRPFRDTNYMPELMVTYRPQMDLGAGFRWSLVNAGFNHQSNGRSDVLSRSWNRLFAEVGVERGNLALFARAWTRISEDEDDDDNPDITDYLGHAEISALYRWRQHSFTGSLRGNVSTGKGAVQLGWMSPPFLGPIRGYVQFFSGYGESLIDYNWKQTTIGAGIALSDGL